MSIYDAYNCYQCNQPFFLDENEVAHHEDDAALDGIDHIEDADHVPYTLHLAGPD